MSIKFASMTVSSSKSNSDACLTQGYAGCGSDTPHPVPWCNTVVLVQKKDGSLHFCVDFHRLNAHAKKDSYPLQRIQEALKSIVGAAHFSTMDFKSKFWQVKMALESQQYITFTVGNFGCYKFTRMPFGLCNAPVTVQCLMQNTLGELNLDILCHLFR